MLTQERYQSILSMVNEKGAVTVAELADWLNISESTVRRDLTALDELGKLKKVFGGATAIARREGIYEDSVSMRETLMRRGAGPTSRLDFSALFFDGGFDRPLTEAAAGELLEPLKAVQRAPSAVNRQPWRVVRCGETLHFYLRHNRGYVTAVTGDLQKVDLGIALCHFALAAEAVGLRPRFSLADPGIEASPDCEYIASYTIG